MKKFSNVLVIIAALIFMVYTAFDIYKSFQPKTSIDLVRKFCNIDVQDYDKYAIDLDKDDYAYIKEFSASSHSNISQYTVIQLNDDVLILKTTPGIVDNRIKVTEVKKISEKDFEKIFNK
jgi:hypothetical protein